MNDRLTTDKLIDIRNVANSSLYRFALFLAALNASVLGFLFTHAILGNLVAISNQVVWAWLGYGTCFIFCLFYVLNLHRTDRLYVHYLAALKNYESRIFYQRERLEIEHSKKLTLDQVIEFIHKEGDQEFIKWEREKERFGKKLEKILCWKDWPTNIVTAFVILVHLITYIASVYVVADFIANKSSIVHIQGKTI